MLPKILYHGSDHIIQNPIYGKGKNYNDYGLGFYCTDNLAMAKEWGVSKDADGFANCYEMEWEGLDVLNLNDPEYCILHWLTVLLTFRTFTVRSELALEAKKYLMEHFRVNRSGKDVIIGYRADDSYFSFAQDLISGVISYRQLTNAMHLGNLGQQFVLKSRKAFNRIRFVGSETATVSEWFRKKRSRDQAARREYFDMERNQRQRNDLYIMQILDERMEPHDPRLR